MHHITVLFPLLYRFVFIALLFVHLVLQQLLIPDSSPNILKECTLHVVKHASLTDQLWGLPSELALLGPAFTERGEGPQRTVG